jgi:2-amino-4-hydroxy-6-hydroxymethyldihydropteridine diphosphokinase
MKTVYLGLGSNIGDREDSLQRAITALHSQDLRIDRLSSVYETSPRDNTDQPWFLNLVAEASTELFPVRLLLRVMNIERRLGRKRTVDKGPRTIDIDILLFGNAVVDTPRLMIPHPRLTERRFVLEPLAELAPDLRHPVTKRSIRDLLGATADQPLRKVSFRPTIPPEPRV